MTMMASLPSCVLDKRSLDLSSRLNTQRPAPISPTDGGSFRVPEFPEISPTFGKKRMRSSDDEETSSVSDAESSPKHQTKQQRTSSRGKSSSSKYRGVCWLKSRQAWRARIEVNGVREHLGYFSNEEAAAKAYDRRAKELNGPTARLNFPDVVEPLSPSTNNRTIATAASLSPNTDISSLLLAALSAGRPVASPSSNTSSLLSLLGSARPQEAAPSPVTPSFSALSEVLGLGAKQESPAQFESLSRNLVDNLFAEHAAKCISYHPQFSKYTVSVQVDGEPQFGGFYSSKQVAFSLAVGLLKLACQQASTRAVSPLKLIIEHQNLDESLTKFQQQQQEQQQQNQLNELLSVLSQTSPRNVNAQSLLQLLKKGE